MYVSHLFLGGRTVETAFEYCRELVEREDHDRYLMILFAPEAVRADLWALFAFNAEIAKTREQVSEPMLGEIRLQWWRDALTSLEKGEVRENPVCEALTGLYGRGDQRLYSDMLALVNARASDLDDQPFKDQASMVEYARSTGGRLQQLAARVITAKPSQDDHVAAGHVGTGWAITGLIRALGFQLAMNRLTVPEDVLAESGISKNSLYQGEIGDDIWPLIHSLASLARNESIAARALAASTTRNIRPLLALNSLTERHLRRIEKRIDDPFKLDSQPSDLPILWRLLKTNLSGRI